MPRAVKAIIVILALMGVSALLPMEQTQAADDNLLAHKLYQEGQFTQAAEIFTDPAWKGIALYRSEQWWRAAEAVCQSR